MFERFTERARQVVVLAQDEARTLKHNYIGTEHLLLGLLREEEGVAAWALESLGISVAVVRSDVVRIVGSGEEVTPGQIPFTPRAKRVLELALREALSLGHNYIGTEHILLGLARENEGVAARVLLERDVDSETIRNEVIRMLALHGIKAQREGTVAHSSHLASQGPLRLLRTVACEVEEQLGRAADEGDLLVALLCVPDGLAARALASLDMDGAAIHRAVEETRRGGARSSLLPSAALTAEIEATGQEMKAKLATRDLPEAIELRDHERELIGQAREETQSRIDKALVRIRRQLGLSKG